MMSFFTTVLTTLRDVLPIVALIFGFQFWVLRQPIVQIKRVLLGLVYVVIGLALFLEGLEQALFPLGEMMAKQLTNCNFLYETPPQTDCRTFYEHLSALRWQDYYWVYGFAAAIGFATTLAEPSLLAVAIKAKEISGGTITIWGLRVSVAIGVGLGIALGSYRIVTGTPLHYYIIVGYIIVIVQTFYAPRAIIPLAYDSGGVTTSTVTVPLVTALGLGLAATIPGRDPLIDGFGLIAFASLFPMITVMSYAQISYLRFRYQTHHRQKS